MDTKERTEESASPSAGIVNCGSPSSLKAIGNLAFLVLAAVLTLTTAAACVLPASQKTEEVVDEFYISGPVNLTIDIFAGSVELVGVDGATNLQIAAEVHEPDRVKYKVAKKGNAVQVTAQQKRRGLGIRRDKLIGKVDLLVRMPTQANMEIRTNIGNIDARQLIGESELRTIAGNISVADSQGEFDMETEIGGISARQIVGEFELRTTAGDISVADGQGEFTLETEIGGISFAGEFTDQSDNLFSTVTGDIEVALVEKPNVELQASTHLAGKIHLGQSVSQSISEMRISGERRNLNMTMGSGTADLSLETQSGNVRIE